MLLPTAIPLELEQEPVGQRVRDWLRKSSLRMTIARTAVLRVLVLSQDPVDAESVLREVVAQGTESSLATVYRILKELEQHGLVEREWHHTAMGTRSCYLIKVSQERKRSCYFQCDVCRRRTKLAEPALATQLSAAAGHEGYSAQQELLIVSRCVGCGKPGAPSVKIVVASSDWSSNPPWAERVNGFETPS